MDKLKIKTKILVDATENMDTLPLAKYGILKTDKQGKINSLVNYTKGMQPNKKLYRTSLGAGKNNSDFHYFPVGMFVPIVNLNRIIVSRKATTKGFEKNEFDFTQLQLSLVQGAGALAAYVPFFDVKPNDDNVGVLQSEVLNFKGQLLSILDIGDQDSAYEAIQLTILSGLLKINLEKGLFYPDSLINITEVKPVLAELFTRSKLWLIENEKPTFYLEDLIALISFTTAREVVD